MNLAEYLKRLRLYLKVLALLGEINQEQADSLILSETGRWSQRLGRASAWKQQTTELKITDRFFTETEGLPGALQEGLSDIANDEEEWDKALATLKTEANVRLGLGLSAEERRFTSLEEMESLFGKKKAETKRKEVVEAKDVEASKREYWQQVMPMLNARIASGQIGYADVKKLITDTNSLIDMGVDPRSFPEYTQSRQYMQTGRELALSQAQQPSTLPSMEQMNQMNLAYEESRGRELGAFVRGVQTPRQPQGITRQPTNWIEYWQMQHGINPDEEPLSRATKWQNFLGEQESSLQDLQAWSEYIEKYPPMVKGSSYSDFAQAIPLMLQAQEQRVNELRTAQPQVLAQPGMGEIPQLPTPAAESWMERLVPGQKAGQPLTKPSILPTPSAQQWQSLLPSEREKFRGYLDWSKVDADDVLFQMQRTLPETPYGAGFSKWQPVRQGRG